MESIDYDILTEEWKVITARMRDESNLFEACNSKRTVLCFIPPLLLLSPPQKRFRQNIHKPRNTVGARLF